MWLSGSQSLNVLCMSYGHTRLQSIFHPIKLLLLILTHTLCNGIDVLVLLAKLNV